MPTFAPAEFRSPPQSTTIVSSLPALAASDHDIGFALDSDGKRLIVISCLDNLGKGAAGQAVQNLNLMLGIEEQTGLL